MCDEQDEEDVAPWADLPLDLLADISLRLHAAADFVYFHAVCMSWRRTLPPHPPRFLPWLLFPRDATGQHRTARCVFSKSSRHAAAAPILRVQDTNNVVVGDDDEPRLVHRLTLTGDESATPLPPFTDEMRAWAWGADCIVSGDGTILLYAFDVVNHYYWPHRGPNFYAAVMRPGDAAWTVVDRNLGFLYPVTKKCRRCCRVLYNDGNIVLCEGMHWCVVNTAAAGADGDHSQWSWWEPDEADKETLSCHVLQSRGELLWVFVHADGGYCRDVRHGRRLASRSLSSALSVSVYALEGQRWVRRDGRSMADRVLFLGQPTSLAMDAAHAQLGGGCAYFVHRWSLTRAGRDRCRVFRYSFDDGRSELVQRLPLQTKWKYWTRNDDDDAAFIWLASPQPSIAPIEYMYAGNQREARPLEARRELAEQLMRIHVGNLPRKVDSDGQRRFVSKDARVMRQRGCRGRSRGFGFATMAIPVDSLPAHVVAKLNGKILDGRPLRVNLICI